MNTMKLFNFDPTTIIPRDTSRAGKQGRPFRYPWNDLQIGQGFTLHDPGAPSLRSMQTMCYQMSRRLDRTFRAQEASEAGIRTIHVGRYQGPSDVQIGDVRPLPSTTPGKPLKLSFDIEQYTEMNFDDAPNDGMKLNMLKPFQYFVWKDKNYTVDRIREWCMQHGGSPYIMKHYEVDECLYKGKKEVLVALTDKKF